VTGVHVVVVAYGPPALLDRCLAQLGGAVPTIVVDNSSSADVRAVAGRRGAGYVDPGSNRGFAAGVNVGLRHVASRSGSCDVLLLNPDAAIDAAGVAGLAAFLHAPGHAAVGVVSPRLVDPDGRAQRVEWPFPSPGRAWLGAFALDRLPPRKPFVVGTVLLLRAEAIRDVGEFDERFFLYAEETDWQRRASASGWTSAVCTSVAATHTGAGTSTRAALREVRFHAGQETYIRKWYGTRGWFVYRSAAVVGAVARALLAGGDRRASARERASLYVRGPRRVLEIVGR
jgi:GT2 family glycosyltransferase